MSWLSGWTYRKSITLSRASGVVTDYQMKLLVGESPGATGEDVDCASHCQTDFDDLRFTTSDGQTLLDYWTESISGTTPNQLATVWIEFDSIGTGATTFYMYYGKSDAPAVSSGANTFIVFDNFERGVNGDDVGGNWTVVNGGNAGYLAIATAQKYGGSRSFLIKGKSLDSQAVSIPVEHGNTYAIRFWAYRDTNGGLTINHGDGANSMYIGLHAGMDIRTWSDSAGFQDAGTNGNASVWDLYELTDLNWTSKTVDIWLNGIRIVDNIKVDYATAGYHAIVSLGGSLTEGNLLYIDDFIVRNWRAVEPTWGSWGSEDQETIISPFPCFFKV